MSQRVECKNSNSVINTLELFPLELCPTQKQLSMTTRDDPKVLILAWYLWNQQCNMPENCTKYKYILCLYTTLTIFV